MNGESFSKCLEAAKEDGFIWAQFESKGRMYMITVEKILDKIMSNKDEKLMKDSNWHYSLFLGSIHCQGSEIHVNLHPFPLPFALASE
jgi:hypothetical protein